MPFVGAVVAPHSPLLLPTVGKEFSSQTKKTRKALSTLAAELYAMAPEAMVVIHPHGTPPKETFGAGVSDRFTAAFTEFGDLVTTATFTGAPSLAHELKEHAEDAGFPLTLLHDAHVPYDVTIPLLNLPERMRTSVPILPFCFPDFSRTTYVDAGRLMGEVLHASRRRVAIVVSAELSQHAGENSPKGFRPEGQAFDASVQKALQKKEAFRHLLELPDSTTELAEACGYRPLLVLSGVIARMNCHVRKLAYEVPFGIGFLTASVQPA